MVHNVNFKFLKNFFVAVALALSCSLYAQSGGIDAWILAQQAFARRDYATAYRYALEELSRNPQNLEARRMAARSAKEQQNYPECLRLVSEIPALSVGADDVGLLGECSSYTQMNERILRFLEQQFLNPQAKDMAAFWLGRYYFRKGEYKKAERYLAEAMVLPARLENERREMTVKLRELLPTPTPVPLPPKANAKENQDKLSEQRPANTTFAAWRFDIETLGGMAQTQGLTPLMPFSQKAFDTTKNIETLEKRKGSFGFASLHGSAELKVGFRLGVAAKNTAPQNFEGTLALTARASGGGSVSPPLWQGARYVSLFEPPPVLPLWSLTARGQGGELAGGAEVSFALWQALTVYGSASFALTSPSASLNLTQSAFLGGARLGKSESFSNSASDSNKKAHASQTSSLPSSYLAFEAYRGLIYGSGNMLGLIETQYRLLAEAHGGMVGFWVPQHYPIARFVNYVARGSKDVVIFEFHDGSFWEFNVAPFVAFSPYAHLSFWYRHVRALSLRYWSAPDLERTFGVKSISAKATKNYNVNFATDSPTALYNQYLSELSLGYFGYFWGARAGVWLGLLQQKREFVDYVPEDNAVRLQKGRDNPLLFQPLFRGDWEKLLFARLFVEREF